MHEKYMEIEKVKCEIKKVLTYVYSFTEDKAMEYIKYKSDESFENAKTFKNPNTQTVLECLKDVYSNLLRGKL